MLPPISHPPTGRSRLGSVAMPCPEPCSHVPHHTTPMVAYATTHHARHSQRLRDLHLTYTIPISTSTPSTHYCDAITPIRTGPTPPGPRHTEPASLNGRHRVQPLRCLRTSRGVGLARTSQRAPLGTPDSSGAEAQRRAEGTGKKKRTGSVNRRVPNARQSQRTTRGISCAGRVLRVACEPGRKGYATMEPPAHFDSGAGPDNLTRADRQRSAKHVGATGTP